MEKVTIQSVEVNVLYMMALAMDTILRDADRRMRAIGGGFKESKRTEFKMFLNAVKSAGMWGERLCEDVAGSTAKSGYKDYDTWLAEANELARLVLLFADKSTEEGASEAVFKALESFNGEGIVTDGVLERFYLQ